MDLQPGVYINRGDYIGDPIPVLLDNGTYYTHLHFGVDLPSNQLDSPIRQQRHAQVFYAPNIEDSLFSSTHSYPDICSQAPELTGIKDGSTLNPNFTTLSWTSNGCHYWVWIGDRPNFGNYHNQSMAGNTKVELSGYPSDGSKVYMTLFYRNTNLIGGPWLREHFTFYAPQ